MTVALIQLNPTVGDLNENVNRLLAAAHQAQQQGAELAVASELVIPGYPPRDLLDRPSFVRDTLAANERIREAGLAIPLLFGSIGVEAGSLTNDAIAVAGGKELGRTSKQLLPTYDVFDERRHFRPGSRTAVMELAGKRCVVMVCEDAWGLAPGLEARYGHDPLAGLSGATADLVLNLSASPFTLPKLNERGQVFAAAARRVGLPLVMVNQVGANDELVFDGQSCVWDAQGRPIARARAFEQDVLLVNPFAAGTAGVAVLDEDAALYHALVLGVRDYARKCGFSKAVLGLSGGIDSALVATLAADALGPENVLGVAMPSRYSSDHSLTDARLLATSLGIAFDEISIEPLFATALQTLQAPVDRAAAPGPGDVTWENVQARLRGAIIMALSNRTSAIALTTGNKSEVAVGYCTLYGDMVGGLAVISDVPKTRVYRLARWINRERERIPQNSIDKAPSAELRPDQKDQDSLPPYDLLDALLELYVEEQLSPMQIIARGYDAPTVERVVALVRRAEYKRRQAAPGLIVTRKAFGPGRRMPIAQRYREGST